MNNWMVQWKLDLNKKIEFWVKIQRILKQFDPFQNQFS